VKKEGKANWDVMKDTSTVPTPAAVTTAPSSGIKILLKKVSVRNSSISYIDESSAMEFLIT